MNPCPHVGTVIYAICTSCRQAHLATSWAAPCWVLRSLVWLLQKVGVHSHHCLSWGWYQKASCKRHGTPCPVDYLLKSLLCNSCKQIQQLTTSGSSNPFPFILESHPRVSSWLSNHQGGHQGHWTPVDQRDTRHKDHSGSLSRASQIWSPAGRMPVSPKQFQDRAFPSPT